jgi:hypothetical protein
MAAIISEIKKTTAGPFKFFWHGICSFKMGSIV